MINKKIWTKKEVEELNEHQKNPMFHEYTCCGHDGCKRNEENNWGKLRATEYGWICPCGKYTQNWSHETGGPQK